MAGLNPNVKAQIITIKFHKSFMVKICLTCLLSGLFVIGFSQKVETVYLDARDSSANLFIAVHPAKPVADGLLFLIPGMFQKAADVLVQTDLAKVAAQNNLLTIIPTFKTGISSLGIDSATQKAFQELVNEVISKYNLAEKPFYVGGFSIGGTCAIKYAELALAHNYPVKPAAIFAVDSPLDFERMYRIQQRELSLPGLDDGLTAENLYMIDRFNKEFGGPPDAFRENYYKGCSYAFSDSSKHAIKPLTNLPIRLYTEPDIDFALLQGVDYYGLNAIDLAALVNDLIKMGNKKVALITTHNKGYRKPNNIKQPHSWSIVDSKDLVKWLREQK